MSKSAEIEKEVNTDFTDMHEIDNRTIGPDLYRQGDAIVDYVSSFLSDDSEFIRIEAVMTLHAVGTETSATALVEALSDSSQEVRQRCARSLYGYLCETNNQIKFESELIKGAALGKPSAAALLLLGFTKSGKKPLLKHTSDTRPVQLFQYSPFVPTSLPAMVALSRLGDEHARSIVDAKIKSGDPDTLAFLLQAIDSIDSPVLLHSLANQTLSDLREIVDPGIPVHAKPARRVADMAVDVFVKRLQLKPSFELTPSRRYKSEKIESLIRLIRDAVPQ